MDLLLRCGAGPFTRRLLGALDEEVSRRLSSERQEGDAVWRYEFELQTG